MRAMVLTGPGRLEVVRVPIPVPAPEQVLVRVEGCGVCASNLSAWEGKPWFSFPFEPGELGHEAYGTIDAVGSNVVGWHPGDRVAMLSYHGYAEYDLAAADSLVSIPEILNGDKVPGEPLGCAMNIMERAGVLPADTVAIVGIGFLGALLTQLAVQAGANVIAVSRRESALSIAREMGASHTVALTDPHQVGAQVKELTSGRLCDVTIEAAGKQIALDLAGEITRERGRLVVAGYHQDGPRQVNMQLWNWRGLDVINAHERDPRIYVRGIRAAVDAVRKGHLKPQSLYTHTFPLDQLGTALDLTRDRPDGFMKALVVP